MRIMWNEKLGLEECPFMIRYGIAFKNLFSIRLHIWKASDDKENFHDHPWWFLTFVLWGSYIDRSPAGRDYLSMGSIRLRSAKHKHTVIMTDKRTVTLMITGPRVRPWGFWVGKKFVRANQYFFKYGHHPCKDGEYRPKTYER